MKKYNKLGNFSAIFQRKDFSYLSDRGLIAGVQKHILHLNRPDNREAVYCAELKLFLDNLNSFCSWMNAGVKQFQQGFDNAKSALTTAISVFKESPEKRTKIPRRYCAKLSKKFLYGMSKLAVGIRKSFDADELAKTNITAEQISYYILNEDEGLAGKFLFNSAGNHNFAAKITWLLKQELIVVLRLLLRPSSSQIRTFNGWRDLGSKHSPVRIVTQKPTFGKLRVYFLFRLSEHREYEKQLKVPPDKCSFKTFK